MATVESILDDVQSNLHDDGSVWRRAELLRWLNDGYRQLLAQAHPVTRPFQIDVPGRTAWSATFEWEDRHAQGTFRRFTTPMQNAHSQGTYRWETEALAGIEPTNSYDCITQLWERAHSSDIDHHFRFALGKHHERNRLVYWDDERIWPISTKETDLRSTRWWVETGEPFMWTAGVGRDATFEVFEVQTDYNQSYFHQDGDYPEAGIGIYGLPRGFSSDASRTYEVDSGVDRWDFSYTSSADVGFATGLGFRFTRQSDDDLSSYPVHVWEEEHLDGDLTATEAGTNSTASGVTTHWWEAEFAGVEVRLGVGAARGLSSANRQYFAAAYDSGSQLLGTGRSFASSANAITVWEIIVPSRDLDEGDTPELIPVRCHRYLRFYVLAKAFGRTGEGNRPDLAQHYASLYQLGVGLLATLGTPSLLDRVYAREQVREASVLAPPRVRFPSTFPAVPR